ncbi:MAG: capsule assembly Wzi family protein [Muribaculaceae bacterium]|nr:capsule assembly Wzi family protein [Muribaculaceae bacterium]
MNIRRIFPAVIAAGLWLTASAERPDSISYVASAIVNASSGDWAPYMIGSWNDGRVTDAAGGWLDVHAAKDLNLGRRFSWSAGVEAMVGGGQGADYDRWNPETDTFFEHREGQAPARLIQLWGEVKFRGVFAMAGMRSEASLITPRGLSSGDITRSTNARPVPGITVGFVDFQNIPFTNGWVQIEGQLMYGRMTDTGYKNSHFNFFSGKIARNLMYTYKRCYFRTKPDQPVFVTLGMQAAGLFGGNTTYYSKGMITNREDRGFHIKDLWEMFFPFEGSGEGYYKGGSLGSWDFRGDVKLNNGTRLAAYFEWPWEDGSSIGRRNGADGLWGVEYRAPRETWVDAAVIEYLDFTNMSGPIHWAPSDRPGTSIGSHATGGDNYWNNSFYGSWTNYGMSIGTPFVKAPLYNSDGYLDYKHNRSRGFHAALEGRLARQWRYKAMVSYQKAWGNGRMPLGRSLHDTSAMIEARWAKGNGSPWSASLQLALDAGTLRGNNFGGMLSVSYSGALKFKKQ